jgi:RNA polymerase sigma factor (sigma-70 family)
MTPDASPAAELLRSAVGRVWLATATDGSLVRRFATDRDDLAFAELVHRFAPAVYAVCRRHLADHHAVDDAFQVVFVLLARKADGLAHPDRVGGWLAGVADRVARTARRRHVRRASVLSLDAGPEPAATPPQPSADLRAVLDDELARLPPHYRQAVLLCDVEGVTRRAAAVQLGVPVGTLSDRLARARAVLGRRLLRRGVLVTAGTVVSSGSVANPPSRLLASAVRVALSDTPPAELLPLLTPETIPMPRGKLLLILVAGMVLAGGVTTGVVLMVKSRPRRRRVEASQNRRRRRNLSRLRPPRSRRPQPSTRTLRNGSG